MHIITRPRNGEVDLLIGHKYEMLIIEDCFHSFDNIVVDAPVGGWTHSKLENINYWKLCLIASGTKLTLKEENMAWNAYLGDLTFWIGSSEM